MKISCLSVQNNISNWSSYNSKNKITHANSQLGSTNNFVSANELYFRGQLTEPKSEPETQAETIANTGIKRITSEAEYDRTLEKIMNHPSWLKGWWTRSDADKYEQAIIPYIGIGQEACYGAINSFLRYGSALNPRFNPEILEEYVRAMDYALKKIDEKYGTYSGIAYRIGRITNEPRSFVSSSQVPEGVNELINDRKDYYKRFYIIYTEDLGHKIIELQKKFNSMYYNLLREKEILFGPDTIFEEITEITPEMLALKRKLRDSIYRDYGAVPAELNTTFVRAIREQPRVENG